jgi:adenylosuccinate lyase
MTRAELEATMDPHRFVGRAPEQVDEFLAEVVEPLLAGTTAADPLLDEVRV